MGRVSVHSPTCMAQRNAPLCTQGDMNTMPNCMHACSVTQQYPTLGDPMDCCLPGSSVHGILQARILEWVAISSSGDLPDAQIKPVYLASPALVGGFSTNELPGKSICNGDKN